MMEQSNEIDFISESTAQEMIDALERLQSTSRDFILEYESVQKDIIANGLRERLAFLCMKIACSTMITRWYWERKLRKFNESISNIKIMVHGNN